MQSTADAHEAWIASLPAQPDAPLTEAEEERLAMLARRSAHFEELAKREEECALM